MIVDPPVLLEDGTNVLAIGDGAVWCDNCIE